MFEGRMVEMKFKFEKWKYVVIGGLAGGLLLFAGCSDVGVSHVLPDGEFMAVFYVDPNGDDLNAGAADAPFATLERARNAVREINNEMTNDILIAVRPGDYVLSDPFVLLPQDSGKNGFKVRYQGLGEPGSARLLGGERVTGWERIDGNIFRVRVDPQSSFNTLYENGIRARKARFPNYEFHPRFPLSAACYLNAEAGTDTVLTWREGDLAGIDTAALGDAANLVFWPWSYSDWHKVTRRIESVNPAQRSIMIPEHAKGPAIGRHARYYVEGARCLLDQAGEFYLDTETATLYYWPRFGNPDEQEIIAPRLNRIVSLEGSGADDPVRDVVIEGFDLACTDTFDAMTGKTLFPWSINSVACHGIIHLCYTESVEIRFNHIHNSGMNGIYLQRSNKRNTLYGNWIENMGISGICLAYHREADQFPKDCNEFNLIANNLIHNLGSVAVDSAGINIWGANDNTIRHCEIFDGARYGITLRGNFTQVVNGSGKMKDTNRPPTENNRIEYSKLYRLGQDSGDMGAIHMAGICSRTVFYSNFFNQLLIEEISAHPSMQDLKPNGIFFDYPEGVTDQVLRNIEIRDNLIPYRTNRTDIRHAYENCSWRDGFDASKMDYDNIGLKADFPQCFRSPGEVSNVSVSGASAGMLNVSWTNPEDVDLQYIRVSVEGEVGAPPVLIPAARQQTIVPAPQMNRIVFFRIQTVDCHGNISQGFLVRAGINPGMVTEVAANGVDRGIHLTWTPPEGTICGYRLSVDDPSVAPVTLGAGETEAVFSPLENYRFYTVHIDVLDENGLGWKGACVKASAGKGTSIPQDAAAWWTFDEDAIRGGLSIGDASGNQNTLFVGNDRVRLVDDGRFGKAFNFDGQTAFLRALAPEALAIGTNDYAISVWIRQSSTENRTERFLDFGGEKTRPGICLMANNTDVRVLFSDGENYYTPYYRGLEMVGKWMHVVVNIDRDKGLSIYVNGDKLAMEDISAGAGKNIPAAEEFFVGRYNLPDERFTWPGDIDQLRIYRRILMPDEVAALYQER